MVEEVRYKHEVGWGSTYNEEDKGRSMDEKDTMFSGPCPKIKLERQVM